VKIQTAKVDIAGVQLLPTVTVHVKGKEMTEKQHTRKHQAAGLIPHVYQTQDNVDIVEIKM